MKNATAVGCVMQIAQTVQIPHFRQVWLMSLLPLPQAQFKAVDQLTGGRTDGRGLHTVVRRTVEPNWGLWVNLGPLLFEAQKFEEEDPDACRRMHVVHCLKASRPSMCVSVCLCFLCVHFRVQLFVVP